MNLLSTHRPTSTMLHTYSSGNQYHGTRERSDILSAVRHHLQKTAIVLAVVSLLIATNVIGQFQSPSSDDVYQREHSLIKPYQGSGMVSKIPFFCGGQYVWLSINFRLLQNKRLSLIGSSSVQLLLLVTILGWRKMHKVDRAESGMSFHISLKTGRLKCHSRFMAMVANYTATDFPCGTSRSHLRAARSLETETTSPDWQSYSTLTPIRTAPIHMDIHTFLRWSITGHNITITNQTEFIPN